MKKPTVKQLLQQAALEAALEAARDHGRGWFVNHSDVLASEACRYASSVYDGDGLGKALVLAFFEGFQQARLHRDEWLKERANQ